MHTKNSDLSKLPMMALDEISTPVNGAQRIVALVKIDGRVIGYKLSDGSVVDKRQGVLLAKRGGIQGVGVSRRNGNEYLKSLPDNSEDNNLSHLPSVKQ